MTTFGSDTRHREAKLSSWDCDGPGHQLQSFVGSLICRTSYFFFWFSPPMLRIFFRSFRSLCLFIILPRLRCVESKRTMHTGPEAGPMATAATGLKAWAHALAWTDMFTGVPAAPNNMQPSQHACLHMHLAVQPYRNPSVQRHPQPLHHPPQRAQSLKLHRVTSHSQEAEIASEARARTGAATIAAATRKAEAIVLPKLALFAEQSRLGGGLSSEPGGLCKEDCASSPQTIHTARYRHSQLQAPRFKPAE